MFQRMRAKIQWAALKSWLGIAGLWGAGLLPCPECGADAAAFLAGGPGFDVGEAAPEALPRARRII